MERIRAKQKALRLEQQGNDSSRERLIRLCDPKMTVYEIKMKAEK